MTAVHVSAGVPAGGQFAPTGRAEADITLTFDDSNGTDNAVDLPLTAEQQAAADAFEAAEQRDADAVIRDREDTARYSTDVAQMEMMVRDEHPWVRAALAKNPAIPDRLMRRLAEDPAPVVRIVVAEHSTDLYDLERLIEDTDPRVRQRALRTRSTVTRRLALETAKWGETTITYGSRTPWGKADDVVHVAPGIASVGTPSHGGLKVSAKRNKQIDPAWRKPGGWYEEDCDAAIVMVSFPDAFPAGHQDEAIRSAKNYHPDAYEQVTGMKLAAGESYGRDRQTFDQAHAQDHVSTWASSSDDHPGMVVVMAKFGGRASTRPGPEKRFLVSSQEYASRSVYGFVIDPARHIEMTS